MFIDEAKTATFRYFPTHIKAPPTLPTAPGMTDHRLHAEGRLECQYLLLLTHVPFGLSHRLEASMTTKATYNQFQVFDFNACLGTASSNGLGLILHQIRPHRDHHNERKNSRSFLAT
jgi:hypothetical protein